jgi:hypothetical protein
MITEEFEDIHVCEWYISVDEDQSILFMIQNNNLSNISFISINNVAAQRNIGIF